jgi:preprotein translocase subunit YajC
VFEHQEAYVIHLANLNLVLFAIFYFLIIKPQQKQVQEHKDMMESLTKGDTIVTSGGVVAKIIKIEDEFFIVENIDKSQLKVSKDYIASKIDK